MMLMLEKVLSRRQVLQIYYGLFHSVAVYGIVGWGGLYDSSLKPLIRLQTRILKIIGVNESDPDRPLEIRQVFVMKSITRHYSELRNEFNNCPTNTRHRSVELPRQKLKIGQRSSSYYAKVYYNKLPNNLKSMVGVGDSLKKNLREAIKTRIVT
ncbi:uncharacterized protein LOC123320142 [Coccinella septempunctata]|uniref:uncharacterized protein LOC123320142 n=1 Tax=Coccinella septempunctata TaxID=41139 RepID=UPI001D07E282|nr:uncharacterized protein LOC123320142 [Coccinella septempunctata]